MENFAHNLKRLLLCIGWAALLWLLDSLLLYSSGQLSFAAALWGGVPAARLLLRLGLTTLLLLWGFIRLILCCWRMDRYRKLSPERRRCLYGAPDSPVRGQRLQYHALRLAALLRMSLREQENLRLLCYCHDIGLIVVPDRLLEMTGDWSPGATPLPPGAVRFSAAEQKLYDSHVDAGAEIAAAIPRLSRMARLICYHEERYDGGGPKSMYGRGLPLACRIFAVVRLYDYFTNPHQGGRVMETAEALDELDFYAGGMLDPDVVAAFRRLMTDRRAEAAAWQQVYAPY